MSEFLTWLKANKDALEALALIVGGLWAVFVFVIDRKSRKTSGAQPAAPDRSIQIYGLNLDDLEAQLRLKRSDAETRIAELKKLVDELSEGLVPPQLDENLFPKNLRVRSFIRGREIVINCVWTTPLRVTWPLFTLLFWGGCTFMASSMIRLPAIVGVVLGIAVWVFMLRKYYVRFNFQTKRATVITPASYQWFIPIPVMVETKFSNGAWIAGAKYASVTLVQSEPHQSEADARDELWPFVKALNWEMGLPLLSSQLKR